MTKKQNQLEDKEPERIDLEKIDFFDLLAHELNNPGTKAKLVMSIIAGIGKNDPAAIKIMQTALEKSVQKTENKPIPILGGITQQNKLELNVVPSNDSAPQDPRA